MSYACARVARGGGVEASDKVTGLGNREKNINKCARRDDDNDDE